MATHLIIDGYNLLAVNVGLSGPMDSARDALVRKLITYRQRKNHRITVVFDGWRHGQAVEGQEQRSGVQVIYSKCGEKADQVVQRLVRSLGAGCAVVSSDHEIVDTARAQGAFVISAREFLGKLDVPRWTSDLVIHKELDTGEEDRPERRKEKKGNPRKLPKSLRQRQRTLKRF